MKARHHIKDGTYYLNNSGHRWVTFENHAKVKVWINTPEGPQQRTAIFFQSFGNFASCAVSYKGRKILTLSYSLDESQAASLDLINKKF